MKEIKRTLITPGELRVRENEDGTPSRTITGYAIVFGVRSLPLWEDERNIGFEVISREAVNRDFLDKQDIKFTMFHDRTLILARSVNGKGTLAYDVDEKGVSFEFDAPATVDGDKALELVRRGELAGCSFAFTCDYGNPDFVEVKRTKVDGRTETVCTVRQMSGIYDFTLAADPAYPDTEASLREIVGEDHEHPKKGDTAWREQVAEMRKKAKHTIQ